MLPKLEPKSARDALSESQGDLEEAMILLANGIFQNVRSSLKQSPHPSEIFKLPEYFKFVNDASRPLEVCENFN